MVVELVQINILQPASKAHGACTINKQTKKDIPKGVLGGMWGSNPRHSEPQIRFRNLLNISRLTIQFNINFCLFWDIFGTLFYTK